MLLAWHFQQLSGMSTWLWQTMQSAILGKLAGDVTSEVSMLR